jgi:hypothetical protein
VWLVVRAQEQDGILHNLVSPIRAGKVDNVAALKVIVERLGSDSRLRSEVDSTDRVKLRSSSVWRAQIELKVTVFPTKPFTASFLCCCLRIHPFLNGENRCEKKQRFAPSDFPELTIDGIWQRFETKIGHIVAFD